ncbi:MAG: type II secretion system F family protein [Methanobacteriota archaeon]
MNRYQRFAYRVLGRYVQDAAKDSHLRISLQRAHMEVRPEVYLATSYLNMGIAFVASTLVALAFAALKVGGVLDVPIVVLVVLSVLPPFVATILYLLTFLIPDMTAGKRQRDIDAKLPYALNYIATMASAGMTPERIFAGLASQPVYGEVAEEALWITRDLRLLGMDMVSAFKAAIDRTPSIRFQDLLQGAITVVTSGGQLKDYFMSKSEQYLQENRQEQKKFLENLGVLAESYVTIVVAAPVFFLVLLSVMLSMGGSGRELLSLGYLLLIVVMPAAQVAFGAAVQYVTPEA